LEQTLRDKRDFENEARLEMQIANLHAKADEANRLIEDQLDPERVARLETEIARLRASLEEQRSVFEDRLARVSRTISTPGDENVPATN
jgi:peptidoglycan hydrolase CwlO-like protein